MKNRLTRRLLVGVITMVVLVPYLYGMNGVVQFCLVRGTGRDLGGLIIDYMRQNDGAWPHDWNDLNTTYARGQYPGFGESLDAMHADYDVDFKAGPRVLAGATGMDARPQVFSLIHAKSSDWTWLGVDPGREGDGLISGYLYATLHPPLARSRGTPPATGPASF